MAQITFNKEADDAGFGRPFELAVWSEGKRHVIELSDELIDELQESIRVARRNAFWAHRERQNRTEAQSVAARATNAGDAERMALAECVSRDGSTFFFNDRSMLTITESGGIECDVDVIEVDATANAAEEA
ncbi:MAG: hypothetical protein ACU85V_00130 [Gammaproteobacteria bacterium]